jgi:two-component system response regulator MprA
MGHRRIVVVDDTATTHRLVELLVHHGGYDVEPALDRADAFAKATARTPDLILMEVEMPLAGLFGHGSAEGARLRAIQIICVIAHGPGAGDRVAFECDGPGRATAPIDTDELLAKVRTCLGE